MELQPLEMGENYKPPDRHGACATVLGIQMNSVCNNTLLQIQRNGVTYLEHGLSLALAVFNRLNGSADGSVRAQAEYLAAMGPALLGGTLSHGDRISLHYQGSTVASYIVGSPVGTVVTEETVWSSLSQKAP